MLSDIFITLGTGVGCLTFRFQLWDNWKKYDRKVLSEHIAVVLLYAFLVALFCTSRGLYSRTWMRRREFTPGPAVKAIGSAALVVTSFIYVAGAKVISREVIGFSVLLSTLFLLAWRYWLRSQAIEGISEPRNVLVVGANASARSLRDYFDRHSEMGFLFKGFLSTRSDLEPTLVQSAVGTIDELESAVRSHFVDEIFIALPLDRELVKEAALRARLAGIDAYVVPDLYDGMAAGAAIEYVGPFPALSLHRQPIPTLQFMLKRIIDIVVSAAALVILSPVMLLVGLAVKFDSNGPIFYGSERVGKKGRAFQCYKFRTMVANADALKEQLLDLNERDGILFKIANDPRITRIGRILRKTSLDELPQFWNVLKGEMSLVGPRPPIASEVEQYDLDYLRRLEVVPGITGLWQVEARQSPSFEDYITLDLAYVENWSMWLDIKLLFKTVAVVLAGTGR